MPERTERMSLPDKKYKTIVIDPPWEVSTDIKHKSMHSPVRQLPYHTMTDEELLKFPIQSICEEDCNVFLWTINSKLQFSFELLEAWGFKFHTILIWDKKDGLNLNGFRRVAEYVYYGYKGKMEIKPKFKNIPTIFSEHRREHSRKPDIFYKLVREATPEPRIDIFARRRHYGFDAWGDQAEEDPVTIESFTS